MGDQHTRKVLRSILFSLVKIGWSQAQKSFISQSDVSTGPLVNHCVVAKALMVNKCIHTCFPYPLPTFPSSTVKTDDLVAEAIFL